MLTIGFLWVLMALAACNPSAEVAEHGRSEEGPNPELSAIDSLMWRQPDSALAVLQQFAVSPQADSLDKFNEHYCQLLISELLYKNDYGQSNRPALQQTVRYFDSLSLCIGVVRNVSTISFLDARAHYINGVGYYELDSAVEACKEYLKALEVMEGHFEKDELTEHRARFMAYTYNRLMELFSAQFMMDPAIACGEKALAYCQKEPSLNNEIPNTLFHIGKQYQKKGEKGKARNYYRQAIEGIADTNTSIYRDIVSAIALNDYQIGLGYEQSICSLRQILLQSKNEEERLARFLTIGAIFSEEGIYDSALLYLTPVFENDANMISQTRASEYLSIIFDSIGDREQSYAYMRFLSEHKKSEGENKALVSKLEYLFQNYKNKKQEKQAEETRTKSIKRTIEITIPIAVAIALGLLVLTKLRSRKLLRKQQEEAKRALEEAGRQHEQELIQQREEALAAERTHRIQQSALSNRLKRSNEELRELKDQIRQQTDSMNPKQEAQALSFNDEPICRLIMERVNDGQFKAQMDCMNYKDYALGKDDLVALRQPVHHPLGQSLSRPHPR